MQPENAIEVRDLTKKFKVFYDKGNQLKEKILFHNRNRYENRWVLNGISFNVRRGEAVGLIGHNGCGKSTTLKLLTKIIYPDSGTIEMRGRVSSLIELGAGFHPDMSGRENIYTNASIFGLSKKEIDARVAQIIEFSELEEFIDNPVRTYSSGMYMRLAFSVAINVDADILLIDEILGVGDAHFQEKCFEKLQSIKKNGTTIVIVSHSMGQIEDICDRSIWIDKGKIRMEGKPQEVDAKYLEYMGVKSNEEKKKTLLEEQQKQQDKLRKEEEKKEQIEKFEFKIKNVSLNEKELTIHYSVGGICEDAILKFETKDGEWIACTGTDLKKEPIGSFETELKQSQLLTYLAGVNDTHENYLPRMQTSGACERVEDYLVIHPEGVMYGPYITLPTMHYKLQIEVSYEGENRPVIAITKDGGNVRVTEAQLSNGKNFLNFTLDSRAENIEFVLSNGTGADVVVKNIEVK